MTGKALKLLKIAIQIKNKRTIRFLNILRKALHWF